MYCKKWYSKKKLCYYKAKTRKLEVDKAKNIESDPSLLLKLEDLKEQVKFLENEKTVAKDMAIESRGWHSARLPQSSQGILPI